MKHLWVLSWLLLVGIGMPTLSAQYPDLAVPYTVEQTGSVAPGHIFLTPHPVLPSFQRPGNLMVLDSAGNLVWFAAVPDQVQTTYSNFYPTDFKPLPNGGYIFWGILGGRQWYLLNDQFELVDSLACRGYSITNAHDIVQDGDHFLLMCDTTVLVDASHIQTTDGIPGSSSCAVSYQVIQEQDADRQVVGEWHSLDHFALEDVGREHWTNPAYMDHTHMNSIRLDVPGQVLISSRSLNEVTAYDRASGALIWRMGGRANTLQLQGDNQFFSAQHDLRQAPNGNYYLYDNGSFGAHYVGRYVEYDLDPVSMQARLVREIRHPEGLRSSAMGNAVVLEDDHVIVDWGWLEPREGKAEIAEYNAEDQLVLEIDLQDPFLSYRAEKQVLSAPLPRPELVCDDTGKTLRAPDGYASYWWNTGETTPEITVTRPGVYQVWVNQGIGYISSEEYRVNQLDPICSGAIVDPPPTTFWSVGPSPASEELEVYFYDSESQGGMLTIFDATGRKVLERQAIQGELVLDVRTWPGGCYILRLEEPNGNRFRKVWIQ